MESRTQVGPDNRFAHRPVEEVLVRVNGTFFYSIAAASLLEAAAPACAARLVHLFADDAPFCEWVTGEWLPAKVRRVAILRSYVEKMWPELDWAAAESVYRETGSLGGPMGPCQPSGAHEALARCAAAAQSGIFYRCLSRWADDPLFREMARGFAEEEVRAFARFSAMYEARRKPQRWSFLSSWRAVAASVRNARDLHVASAFQAVSAQCGGNVPFDVLNYADFLSRMRAVIERSSDLGTPERLLFRAWRRRPRAACVQESCRTPARFKPVFQTV